MALKTYNESFYKIFFFIDPFPAMGACTLLYTVSQKNDTDVAGYIFNAHQLILVVFGREIGERVCD